LDRFVNLVDEGVDIALRIGNLSDSTHISTRIGGDVRRVVVAAPQYLENNPVVEEPSNLSKHAIIAFSNFGLESWSFAPTGGSTIPRTVHFAPRYVVNSVRAAAASAAEGIGITRLYSYHVAEYVRDGRLKVILSQDEPPALPIHILAPQGRAAVPKVRAFIDFAVPHLRSELRRIAVEAGSLP
jgi:DNA-binding transcriptional LysR family regulator